MKLVVFSDTHGNSEDMLNVLEKEEYDVFVFLGDGQDEARKVMGKYPNLPTCIVSGNCDCGVYTQRSAVMRTGGINVLAVHGDRHGVNGGLDELAAAARSSNAQVVLYGHTHVSRDFTEDGIRYVNPGYGKAGEYAVVDVNEKGHINVSLRETE